MGQVVEYGRFDLCVLKSFNDGLDLDAYVGERWAGGQA